MIFIKPLKFDKADIKCFTVLRVLQKSHCTGNHQRSV